MLVLVQAAEIAARELLLFAAVGLLLCGVDDMVVDIAWIVRGLWRHLVIRTRHARATAATLTHRTPGRIAIFVPAWQEDAIIGAMIDNALRTLKDDDYRIYVGLYPNDSAARAVLNGIADFRVRVAVNTRPGPTTKADCLNVLWDALVQDDAARGERSLAVVLHDAEDIIHPDELIVHRALIDRFQFVQLPVLPIINPRSAFIEGHYADEFAESHGKELVVREAVRASIPAAGVGCAFRCEALERIAQARHGAPFDASSLVEDYELGLRMAEIGARGIFVRIRSSRGEPLVAVRSCFPTTVAAAVRQKARWAAGIALAGWDRLGWRGGVTELWFRLRDRKALLAALVIFAAYAGMLTAGVAGVSRILMGVQFPPPDPHLALLFLPCTILLLWRLVMRVTLTTRLYGPVQGLLSIPRMVVSNAITILAVRRALGIYLRARRDGVVRWDKTANRFSGAAL